MLLPHTFPYARIAALLVILGAVILAAVGDCPPCYSSFTKIKEADPGEQVDGKVCGTESAFGSHQSTITSALDDAISNWNSASSGGQNAPYKFIKSCTSADIQIKRMSTGWAAANYDDQELFVGNDAINYYSVKSNPEDYLSFAIAHELGHFLGLGNLVLNTSCSSEISTMGSALNRDLYPPGVMVSSSDVDRANDAFGSNQATECNYVPAQDSGIQCAGPCMAVGCPGFDEETCTNSDSTDYPVCDDVGAECWEVWEITSYYLCDGTGCSYLYSDYQYLDTECSPFFNVCG